MFSVLDWVIIAIIGLSAIFGFIVGFIRSMLSLLIWIGAVVVSMVMGPALTHYFSAFTDNAVIQLWASYGVVFVASALIGWILKLILSLVLIGRQRGGLDGLLGIVFGLARGMLLVIVLMWFALLCGIDQTTFYKQSRLAPVFTGMTVMVAQLFPGAAQTIQQAISSTRMGTQNLMNSASGALNSGIGGVGLGGSGSQSGGIMSSLQSGLSQATSAVKSNLGGIQ